MVSMKEAAEYCTHHRASPGEDLPSTFCNEDHDDDQLFMLISAGMFEQATDRKGMSVNRNLRSASRQWIN